jgi:hypothetical protein
MGLPSSATRLRYRQVLKFPVSVFRPGSAEPAAADIPAAGEDVGSGEFLMPQLPKVLVMRDASDGSQMGSCSVGSPKLVSPANQNPSVRQQNLSGIGRRW